MDRRWHRQA